MRVSIATSLSYRSPLHPLPAATSSREEMLNRLCNRYLLHLPILVSTSKRTPVSGELRPTSICAIIPSGAPRFAYHILTALPWCISRQHGRKLTLYSLDRNSMPNSVFPPSSRSHNLSVKGSADKPKASKII